LAEIAKRGDNPSFSCFLIYIGAATVGAPIASISPLGAELGAFVTAQNAYARGFPLTLRGDYGSSLLRLKRPISSQARHFP